MKELRIVVDAGHGGRFNGATGETSERGLLVSEARLNLAFAINLIKHLNARGNEIIPYLTPRATSSDLDEDLSRRAHFANQIEAHCFVSLHCNWFADPRARGFEVFTSPGETQADQLAERIIHELMHDSMIDIPARPDKSDGDLDKEAKFKVLMDTDCPAVLVELGFLSNPYELKTLQSALTQHAMTFAIANGILNWAREG